MIGDLGRYAGREQAYVKHFLLGEYLEIFAHKIGSAYPEIAYVDGFSGPWQNTGEAFEDTSFGIALAALTRAKATWKGLGRDLKVSAYLVEKNPAAYANLQSVRTLFPGVEIKTYPGSFIERAPELLKDIPARAFAFLFIDPKGWAIDMQRIAPLLKRPNSRSCSTSCSISSTGSPSFRSPRSPPAWTGSSLRRDGEPNSRPRQMPA